MTSSACPVRSTLLFPKGGVLNHIKGTWVQWRLPVGYHNRIDAGRSVSVEILGTLHYKWDKNNAMWIRTLKTSVLDICVSEFALPRVKHIDLWLIHFVFKLNDTDAEPRCYKASTGATYQVRVMCLLKWGWLCESQRKTYDIFYAQMLYNVIEWNI